MRKVAFLARVFDEYDLSGLGSRRINDEPRLVYRVTDEEIVVVSCKFHY